MRSGWLSPVMCAVRLITLLSPSAASSAALQHAASSPATSPYHHGLTPSPPIPTTAMPRRPLSPPWPRAAASSHHRGLASLPTPRLFPRSTLSPPSYCPKVYRDVRCWTRCRRRHLELD
uniref:Secreted protein n=1 Tax=Triticum urartu TaxID=4572 RepID=A0A8R7RBH5_TRIUA